MSRISPKGGVPMMPFFLDAEQLEVDICPVTKGIWLDLGELRMLTGLAADLPFFHETVPHARDTQWQSPTAACVLREIRFHPHHDVVLDYCPVSGGIWLDKGELDKVKAIASSLGSSGARSATNAARLVPVSERR